MWGVSLHEPFLNFRCSPQPQQSQVSCAPASGTHGVATWLAKDQLASAPEFPFLIPRSMASVQTGLLGGSLRAAKLLSCSRLRRASFV